MVLVEANNITIDVTPYWKPIYIFWFIFHLHIVGNMSDAHDQEYVNPVCQTLKERCYDQHCLGQVYQDCDNILCMTDKISECRLNYSCSSTDITTVDKCTDIRPLCDYSKKVCNPVLSEFHRQLWEEKYKLTYYQKIFKTLTLQPMYTSKGYTRDNYTGLWLLVWRPLFLTGFSQAFIVLFIYRIN